jgi:hypothetical protein
VELFFVGCYYWQYELVVLIIYIKFIVLFYFYIK